MGIFDSASDLLKDKGIKEYMEDLNLIEINNLLNYENINDKLIVGEYGKEYTPLEYVLHLRDDKYAELIKSFLKIGASITELVNQDMTPKRDLARGVLSADIIKILHERGVNLNYNWSKGMNFLSYFLKYRCDHDSIKAILDLKLPLVKEDENLYFWVSVLYNELIEVRTVKMLLDAGYPYKGAEENSYCDALLHSLLYCGISEQKRVDILDMMDANGYDLEFNKLYNGKLFLKSAIELGFRMVVTKLVELGVDYSKDQVAVSRMLLKKDELKGNFIVDEIIDLSSVNENDVKAYIDKHENFAGKNVVGPLITNDRFNSVQEYTQKAIDKGADLNIPFHYTTSREKDIYCSPLYAVCTSNDSFKSDDVIFLIKNGAEDLVENRSALFLSISESKFSFIEALLDGGVDPNITIRGAKVDPKFTIDPDQDPENCRLDDKLWISYFYPSDLRVKPNFKQKRKMFDLLLKGGLRSDIITDDGSSALDIAIQYSDIEFVEYMFESDFVPEATNNTLSVALENITSIDLLNKIIDSVELPQITAEMAANFFKLFEAKKRSKDCLAIFERLVELGLDLTGEYEEESIFLMAMSCRNREVISYMMQRKDELNITEDAVLWAVHYLDDVELIGDIVSMFPDYEAEDAHTSKSEKRKESGTAITLAINKECWVLAKYLMQRFPNMRAYSTVRSLIVDAFTKMEDEDWELISMMMDREPDLDRFYYDSDESELRTILAEFVSYYSSNNNYSPVYLEVIELLLKHGASTDILYYERVDKSSKIDPDIYHMFAMPLYWTNGNFEFCKPLFDLLIEYGAEPAKPIGSFNESSIVSVIQRQGTTIDEAATIKYLNYIWDRTGFDINETNRLGNNLITCAAMIGKPASVRWLAEHGGDVNHIGGFDNSNPIHKCISNYSFTAATARSQTVEALLDLGVDIEVADPDPEANGATPLMTACQFGIQSVIDLLLKRGADINAVTPIGYTPLLAALNGDFCYDIHQAIEGSKLSLIEFLVKRGAEINIITGERSHPLIEAMFKGRSAIFKRLLELGADPYMIDPNMQQEVHKKVGFNQPKRADEHGTNPLGFILMNGDRAKKYFDILVEFLGKDIVAQAQKDIARFNQPIKPQAIEAKQKAEKMMADLMLKTEQLKVELEERAAAAKESKQKDLEENPIIENQDKELNLNEVCPVLFFLDSNKTKAVIKLNYIEVRALGTHIREVNTDADMRNGENWKQFILALMAKQNRYLREFVDGEVRGERCYIELKSDHPTQADITIEEDLNRREQMFNEFFQDLFATRRSVINAFHEVKGDIDWLPYDVLVSKLSETEESEAGENPDATISFPIDEIIKRSAFMGLVNINFQISSESMVGLARNLESVLHIELVESGEAWANLLRLIVEKRTPHIVECIDFDGIGNHFTATIDGKAEGGKEVIAEFETVVTALFQSEEIFVREVMLIKSELRSACSTL